ncbi:DNA translocase FtsK [Enterovirga sp.]|uniref:DNA translocase FtsK n=1 Tax=Enterovirga sp. TaxID=2026350 RepID=UPI00262CC52D|nr:DNA translocase FtsK [Enterovirga sp.]MDB5590222.1 translocase FtsK [Enterovirga sp.]
MHTYRRHETPLERLSDLLVGFLRRRVAEGAGLALLAGAAAIGAALASWSVKDPSLNHATSAPIRNWLGAPGAITADLIVQVLGLGAAAFLIAPAIWGVALMRHGTLRRLGMRLVLWAAGTWAAAAAVSAFPTTPRWPLPTGLGGVAGDALLGATRTITGLAGPTGAAFAGLLFGSLAAFALAAACGLTGRRDEAPPEEAPAHSPRESRSDDRAGDDEPSWAIIWLGGLVHGVISARAALGRRIAKWREEGLPRPALREAPAPVTRREPAVPVWPEPSQAAPTAPTPALRSPRPTEPEDESFDAPDSFVAPAPKSAAPARAYPEPSEPEEVEDDFEPVPTPRVEAPVAPRAAVPERPQASRVAPAAAPIRARSGEAPNRTPVAGGYEKPPLPLLAEPKKQVSTVSKDALEQNATLLESTLEDFGVRGEIINVRPGPVVTLYELEPAPGTKSSRVIGLADDIARSMSAVSARVAVVPGRNVIGIELPNAKRETVFLRELLASTDFADTKQKLALCLGKTIGGEPVIADLARMPHLLVAGTTGSGKSVAINTMILSLLYMHTPEQCRLIMVDPKMLELSVYDGIPHLLSPVVTDPKKAVIALKWAVREMEERYKKMSKLGVRNIDGFNARVLEAKQRHEVITRTVQTGFDRETGEAIYEDEIMDLEQIPYIVVIVDEMADLMMVAGKDIEGAIQRLAQMARAAGIHLIMATQRPSVDVITGTIKANFPTRISFQVTSKIDSRTILGEMGAEQLLGQGDMLYMAGGGRITRVHGPFVADSEVEKVVAHLKAQGRPQYLDSVTSDEDGGAGEGDESPAFDKGAVAAAFGEEGQDPYDQAIAVVLRDKKASTSYIQRRLGIGYNRAASIMERMEKEGIVGPANHAGKREILVESGATSSPYDD